MVNKLIKLKQLAIVILKGNLTQAGQQVKLLAILLIIPVIFLAVIFLISWKAEIPIGNFMKDPVTVTHSPFYTGMVSIFGVLFWFGSSIICFFTSFVIRQVNGSGGIRFFAIYFGVFTILLMLDDLLLLHEQVLPEYLGTSEKLLYGSYMLIFAIGFLQFYPIILKTNYLFLALGILFFGLSITVDLFQERIQEQLGEIRVLLEDGFKFTGIFLWFGYFATSCKKLVNNQYLSVNANR